MNRAMQIYTARQALFSTELPAIPLYYRLRVAVARPDVCGFDLDPTANPLWNIEAIDKGEACQNLMRRILNIRRPFLLLLFCRLMLTSACSCDRANQHICPGASSIADRRPACS